MPLVIRPALELSPSDKPSEIPAPMAIIFFIAPAIDAPITSLLKYNRKVVKKSEDICLAKFSFLLAMSAAEGKFFATSSANVEIRLIH